MIFLYSMISSSKSMVGIIVIPSPCPCWTSASLAAAFLCAVLLVVLRLVSVRSPMVRFSLPLALLFSCLLLPQLFSVLFHRCSRSSMFFSLSSYPCCFTSFLSPQARWLWFLSWIFTTCSSAVLSLSHHWLFGCGFICASLSESLCGKLRLRGSFLTSSTTTTQRCALRD